MSLMMSPPAAGISAFPESDSDLTYWVGRLEGAEVRSPFPLASLRTFKQRELCLTLLEAPVAGHNLRGPCLRHLAPFPA